MKISRVIELLEKVRAENYGRDEEVVLRVNGAPWTDKFAESYDLRICSVVGEAVDGEDGTQNTYAVIRG